MRFPNGRATSTVSTPRLGLRENWEQFALLVVVNAFVGGMVGLERTVVPLLAEQDFGEVSRTVALSFIVSFGIVKAVANLGAGHFSDRIGRKPILVAGWIVGLPVPFLIMLAPTWSWVVFANVLLGINQGLCWSTTVIMKIDLVGPAKRGLAMGLNEAAGYLSVAGAALASGYVASSYGLRPEPFYLGVVFAVAGLLLSVFTVHDSHGHARREAALHSGDSARPAGPSFGEVFALATWRDRRLFATSQAGLINNLNDGMAWGLFPLFFAAGGLGLDQIAVLAAIYPGVWGVTQLLTGSLSDQLGRKGLIAAGMWVQAAGIFLILLWEGFRPWALGAVLLGLGTAMVYPTLLAAIGDIAHPEWRASAVGVYRLWRDSGYAIGALLAGAIADLLGLQWAIGAVGVLTLASGAVVATVMTETLPGHGAVTAPVPHPATGPG
ncbi:MAG: MFS transporter [Chloroflexota bacterium]|nr:MFS transporter [Chloroflexota bacterium]